MRVAVLGDIHANASALSAALATVDAGGYDKLVMLGDLLTYGADVEQTIDLVSERLDGARGVLLRGNHDALYRDLLVGERSYFDGLPGWIRESVLWSLDKLPVDRWRELPFDDEVVLNRVVFSHANPFGPGRWEYLSTEADHANAVSTLRARELWAGVFGHTHRAKRYAQRGATGAFAERVNGDLEGDATYVLNAGAVGQPRDPTAASPAVLWLTLDASGPFGGTARASLEQFEYDVAEHRQRVVNSGMPEGSVERIIAYFSGSAYGAST